MSALAHQVALISDGNPRLPDRVIEVGLAQRVQCPTERRGWLVALTAVGAAVQVGAGRCTPPTGRVFQGLNAR